jgi:hypothetical protein
MKLLAVLSCVALSSTTSASLDSAQDGSLDFARDEQSLADAAKKAGEQRKENSGPLTTFTQLPASLNEIPLNRTVVDTYVNARVALAKLCREDPALYDRVRSRGQAIDRLRDFSRVLASEPALVDALTFYNLTPETAVDIDATLHRALVRTRGGYGDLTSIELQNTEYMGKDLGYVQYAILHYFRQVGALAWPEGLPY